MPGLGTALVAAAIRKQLNDGDKTKLTARSSPSEEPESSRDFEGKLRDRKLEALRGRELSPSMMRSLFRLLDEDGSFELSASEIKKGMLLLGFNDASDPVALTRLLQDIDEDRTGTITEGEFMGFFGAESRSSVAARLRSYIMNAVSITATFFGTDADGQRKVRTEVVPPHKLAEWIAALPADRGRLWLDVVGYSPSVHAVLAASLGLTLESICDVISLAEPGVELIKGIAGAPPVAKIITQCMSCSSEPLSDSSGGDGWFSRRAANSEGDGGVDSKALQSKAHIESNPPAVSMEQAALIIPDDRTLVTLRPPAFEPDDSLSTASGARVSPAREGEHVNAIGSDPSAIRPLYDNLRDRMAAGTSDTTLLFKSSIKALAVAVVDTILQFNFKLRDGLIDWQDVLEREIRKTPNSLHTPHLDALLILARGTQAALGPVGEGLDPANWKDRQPSEQEEGEVKDEEKVAAAVPPVPSLRSRTSTRKAADFGLGDLSPVSLAYTAKSSAAGSDPHPDVTSPGAIPDTLDWFFHEHLDDFRELSRDCADITKAVRNITGFRDEATGESSRGDVDRLRSDLASRKADFMNKTLFSLTLITAVSVPITFLTGLWGMNFEDMLELRDPKATMVDPATGEEMLIDSGPGFGYKTFWLSLVAVVVTEVCAMWKLGMFEALK